MGLIYRQSCSMVGSPVLLLLAVLGVVSPIHFDRPPLGGALVGLDTGHIHSHLHSHLESHLHGHSHRHRHVHVHRDELDTDLASGRFKLKHHFDDGFEDILKAFDLSEDDIESMRDATIITEISVEDDGISIATSEAGGAEQSNVITAKFGRTTNITHPLNGETVEFTALPLSPTTLQTTSEGVDSGTLEVKTWEFSPFGLEVTTEVLKDNRLYSVHSHQVMARVDSRNRDKPLRLGWV